MVFDNPSLFQLLCIQGLATALALALLIGRHASPAARSAQLGMGLQACGWLALAASGGAPEHWLLGGAMFAFSGALSALWFAVLRWLPNTRRHGRWFMLAAPLLMPVVYVALIDATALRIGWAQGWLALQLLMLAAAVALPQRPAAANPPGPANDVQIFNGHRWRALLFAAVLPLAIVCLLRGGLAFAEPPVRSLFSAETINTAMALSAQLALSLLLPALLLAWRAEVEAELARLAQTDGLTGLADRRAFAARAVDMISMARRHQEPLALMLLDIDFLKAVNTEHGQDAGDRALALFASCLQEQLRLGDLAGRVGGEEFAVLMARCEALGPPALDKRMRDALVARAGTELGFALDFSAGWAKLRRGDRHLDDLMRRGETALYEAKRNGRGRLVAEPGLESEEAAGPSPEPGSLQRAGTGLA
ncbi:hypothetical protein BH11PSE10_BH11PSE10_20080 [soil metagenome]